MRKNGGGGREKERGCDEMEKEGDEKGGGEGEKEGSMKGREGDEKGGGESERLLARGRGMGAAKRIPFPSHAPPMSFISSNSCTGQV